MIQAKVTVKTNGSKDSLAFEDFKEGTERERDRIDDWANTDFPKDYKLIAANREIIHCHKIFLCARSDVFNDMLTDDNFNEGHNSEVKIKEFGPQEPQGLLALHLDRQY